MKADSTKGWLVFFIAAHVFVAAFGFAILSMDGHFVGAYMTLVINAGLAAMYGFMFRIEMKVRR